MPENPFKWINYEAGLLTGFIIAAIRALEFLFQRYAQRKRERQQEVYEADRNRVLSQREDLVAKAYEDLRKEMREEIKDLRDEVRACEESRLDQAEEIKKMALAAQRCEEQNQDLQRRVADLQNTVAALQDQA